MQLLECFMTQLKTCVFDWREMRSICLIHALEGELRQAAESIIGMNCRINKNYALERTMLILRLPPNAFLL